MQINLTVTRLTRPGTNWQPIIRTGTCANPCYDRSSNTSSFWGRLGVAFCVHCLHCGHIHCAYIDIHVSVSAYTLLTEIPGEERIRYGLYRGLVDCSPIQVVLLHASRYAINWFLSVGLVAVSKTAAPGTALPLSTYPWWIGVKQSNTVTEVEWRNRVCDLSSACRQCPRVTLHVFNMSL